MEQLNLLGKTGGPDPGLRHFLKKDRGKLAPSAHCCVTWRSMRSWFHNCVPDGYIPELLRFGYEVGHWTGTHGGRKQP